MDDDREDKIQRIITDAEREHKIQLTVGAKQMLTVPILEQTNSNDPIDWNELTLSIQDIIKTMATDQEAIGPTRGAVVLIRAFHLRFCNIPPFCTRRPTLRVR
jgi:uncharacterized protein YpuA (DUF1002 family)